MRGSTGARASLWFALVFPSAAIVFRYLGAALTFAYAATVAVIVAAEPWRLRLSPRAVRWLALVTLLAVVIAFAVVYPTANTHVPGAGSDDDDGLNMAARALLGGHFPYGIRTYLGNADHHLAGALMLAVPFVLAGTSALQNLFWLPLFFLVAARESDGPRALQLAWVALLLSPSLMWEVVTGTGYSANAVYVALGLWWLIRSRGRDLAAVAWGITLASRANFLWLVPLAFGYLRQHHGRRAAWRAGALACGAAGVLTLPFYVYDPQHFGPLEGANRLLAFDELAPHLGIALMIAMTALAVALAATVMDVAALFRNAAIVQGFPAVAGVVLATVADRRLDLSYARYGAFFAWFAFLALVTHGTMAATPQCLTPPGDDYGSNPQARGKACR